MSTCISREGEYSDHEPGDWCPRCGAFNEEAIVAERDRLRGFVADTLAFIDKGIDNVADLDPNLSWKNVEVIEAFEYARALLVTGRPPVGEFDHTEPTEQEKP